MSTELPVSKEIGIYKITSPSGRVYIGQSWNIARRWREHSKVYAPLMGRWLCKSIHKYGYNAHKFEIIHSFPFDITQTILDEYEIYYIEQYTSCGISMLNLKGGGSTGKVHEETKRKISFANAGKKKSDKEASRNRLLRVGMEPWNKGKIISAEMRMNYSIGHRTHLYLIRTNEYDRVTVTSLRDFAKANGLDKGALDRTWMGIGNKGKTRYTQHKGFKIMYKGQIESV